MALGLLNSSRTEVEREIASKIEVNSISFYPAIAQLCHPIGGVAVRRSPAKYPLARRKRFGVRQFLYDFSEWCRVGPRGMRLGLSSNKSCGGGHVD